MFEESSVIGMNSAGYNLISSKTKLWHAILNETLDIEFTKNCTTFFARFVSSIIGGLIVHTKISILKGWGD